MAHITKFPNLCLEATDQLQDGHGWERELPSFFVDVPTDILYLAWSSLLKCYTSEETVSFLADTTIVSVDIITQRLSSQSMTAIPQAFEKEATGIFKDQPTNGNPLGLELVYVFSNRSSILRSWGLVPKSHAEQLESELCLAVARFSPSHKSILEWPASLPLSILNPAPQQCNGPALLHDLVFDAARGDSCALDFLDESQNRRRLSYSELDIASTDMARRIGAAFLNIDTKFQPIVPVLIPQSIELYIALVGILKSGCGFCPLQLDAPPERLKYIISDVSATLVVTTPSQRKKIQEVEGLIILDMEATGIIKDEHPNTPTVVHTIDPTNIAYIMYTSGSTGTPKGVPVSHSAVTQSLLAHDTYIPRFSRFLQFASPTFDVSMFEIFFTFHRGSTLVGCDRDDLLNDVAGMMRRLDVDAAELTPTVAGGLLRTRQAAPALRLLLTIGEMLTPQVVQEFGGNEPGQSILWAMYGPTEAAIHCTLEPAFRTSYKVGIIGKPLDTVSALIVGSNSKSNIDSTLEVLPVGQVGELALGGFQLADGYLNRPQYTATVFLDTKRYGRVYLTGDKARILPCGMIECLGRISSGQVKLRGQRIELGEIEQVALKTPGCRGAIARVLLNNLILFCLREARSLDRDRILQTCSEWLPSYMLPSDVVILDEFPYLPSGKVDRKLLKRTYLHRTEEEKEQVDGGKLDKESTRICGVLSAVLRTDIHTHDNLSMCGLDSLTAIRAATQLRRIGLDVSQTDLLKANNARELVTILRSKAPVRVKINQRQSSNLRTLARTEAQMQPLIQSRWAEIADVISCTPLQLSMLSETAKDPRVYWNSVEIDITSSCASKELRSCIEQLAAKNEILRSGFIETNHVTIPYVQVIWKCFDEASFDPHSHVDAPSQLMDPESLLRPIKVRISCHKDRSTLLLTLHHALYDGWSIDLLLHDLRLLLQGFQIPDRPQFRDVVDFYNTVDNGDMIRYWQDHLAGFTPKPLPKLTGTATQTATIFGRYHAQMTFPWHKLRASAKRSMTSPQSFLQAAVAYVIGSYIGSSDICLAVVTSGRSIPVLNVEDVMGPCISTVPVRINIAHVKDFSTLICNLHTLNRRALEHGNVSFRDIKRACGFSTAPTLSDVLFIWQETLESRQQNFGQLAKLVKSTDQLEFKLTVELEPRNDALFIGVTFDENLISRAQIQVMVEQVDQLVAACIEDTGLNIDDATSKLPDDLLSIRLGRTVKHLPNGKQYNRASTRARDITNRNHAHYPSNVSQVDAKDDESVGGDAKGFVVGLHTANLVLMGAVGEICFEVGPNVNFKLEYPSNSGEKLLSHARFGLLYRTGELGRLLSDGSISSLGQVEEQIQLRRHTFQLQDIDNIILRSPEISNSVTIAVGEGRARKLISFFACSADPDANSTAIEIRDKPMAIRDAIFDKLTTIFPEDMVPAYLIPIPNIPTTAEGKVDKSRLATMYTSIPSKCLQTYSSPGARSVEDKDWTETERLIAEAVADVANVSRHDISKTTSFFALGIDSLSAITLSKRLKAIADVKIPVSIILQNATISRLATKLADMQSPQDSSGLDLDAIFSGHTRRRCKLAALGARFSSGVDFIRQIRPCTPLQEAMLSASFSEKVETYTNIMLLKTVCSTSAMKAAWEAMVARHDILRTCFVQIDEPSYPFAQVVLADHRILWDDMVLGSEEELQRSNKDIRGYLSAALDQAVPPYRLSIVRLQETSYLRLACHHAIYDATGMAILFQEVESHMRGESLHAPVPYEPFLRETVCMRSGDAIDFWCRHLAGHRPVCFESPRKAEQVSLCKELQNTWSQLEIAAQDLAVSPLSLIQAAWVKILSHLLGEHDICFGNVVSGRTLPLDGLNHLIAPTFNTVPVRVDLNQCSTYSDLVVSLQKHNSDALSYQLAPLREIKKRMGFSGLTVPSTLLLLQQSPYKLDPNVWELESDIGYLDSPLVIELIPDRLQDLLLCNIHFQDVLVDQSGAFDIITGLDSVLSTIVKHPASLLSAPLDLSVSLAHKTHSVSIDVKNAHENSACSTNGTLSTHQEGLRQLLSAFSNIPADDIGPDTTIFQLGIDSISAIQLASRLQSRQGSIIVAADILRCPRLADLAELLNGRSRPNEEYSLAMVPSSRSNGLAEVDTLNKFDKPVILRNGLENSKFKLQGKEAVLPCTPIQYGLLSQFLGSESGKDLYVNAMTYELPPEVDQETVVSAWQAICSKHPILRTGFVETEDPKSPYAMLVYNPGVSAVKIPNIKGRYMNLEEYRQSTARRIRYSLHEPVWRSAIVNDTHPLRMHLAILHAIFDAHSLQLILEDFILALQGRFIDQTGFGKQIDGVKYAVLSILHSGFPSRVVTQRKRELFWQKALDGGVPCRFPNLSPLRNMTGHMTSTTLQSAHNLSKLEEQCRLAGFTLHVAGQAAWARLLATYTAQAVVVFGTVLSGRDAFPDATRIAFPCLTTVPTVAHCGGSNGDLMDSLMQFNNRVREHQFTPLWTFQRPSEILFDTMFALRDVSAAKSNELKIVEDISTAEYVVSIELERHNDEMLVFRLTYQTDVLPVEHAKILLKQLDAILHNIMLPSGQEVQAATMQFTSGLLSSLPAPDPILSSPAPLLHELVELSARTFPQKIALEFATEIKAGQVHSRCWTYRELDQQANKVAQLIYKQGISAGNLVAICFDKCPEASFATLGTLKAGCAYVAIDPGAPLARKLFIIQDSKAALILTANRAARKFYRADATRNEASHSAGIDLDATGHLACEKPFIYLDEYPLSTLTADKPSLKRAILPDDFCYCLYTSGTTGTPKGCLITHENAVQAMRAFSKLFEGRWDANSRWFQFASFHFDVSVLEQYWSWSEGLRVVSAPRDLVFRDLADTLRSLKITHIDLTPSLALLIGPEDVPSLCDGVFVTGGEQLKQEVLDVWGPKEVIFNAYGPTETTIGVTVFRRVPKNGKPTNIGQAFPNVALHVLQAGSGTPVLRGAIGELCISGKLVGKGYLNRPDLTAEKFPYITTLKTRVYRTGDLVRMLHDGSLEFLGRADDQVKLRGQRLEIGEINSVVRNGVSEIEDVATYVLKHGRQQKEQLVCFFSLTKTTNRMESPSVLCQPEAISLLERARGACLSKLPPYMVPTHFIPLSHIPLTVNNKIDARKLSETFSGLSLESLQRPSDAENYEGDLSPTEKRVIDALETLFKTKLHSTSRQANIFELGLDSISAVRLARILDKDGSVVPVSLVMSNPTIKQLSDALEALQHANNAQSEIISAQQRIAACQQWYRHFCSKTLGVPPGEIDSIARCTPLQQGMISRYLERSGSAYMSTFRLFLTQSAVVARLKEAWLRAHLEIPLLRTRFIQTDEGHIQVILKQPPLPWRESINVGAQTMDESAADMRTTWLQNIDGPLIRPFQLDLIRTENTVVLLVHMFHGLYDGVSLSLLLSKIYAIYNESPEVDFGPSFVQALPYGPLRRSQEAETYWMSRMKDYEFRSLKEEPLIATSEPLSVTVEITQLFSLESTRRRLGVTHQALIQACWATVLRSLLGEYVTMGIVSSGRSINLKDARNIIGPMFNTLPFCVKVDNEFTWEHMAKKCHEFITSSTPFQHTALRDIQKWCKVPPKQGLFENLFVFQLVQDNDPDPFENDVWAFEDTETTVDYPIAFEVHYRRNGSLRATLVTDPAYVSYEFANQLLDKFQNSLNGMLANFASAISATLGHIDFENEKSSQLVHSPKPLQQSKLGEETGWTKESLTLRQELASIAGVGEEEIHPDTSIFELGLDSIDAIKLSSRLARTGFHVSVGDIMQNPSVSRLVRFASKAAVSNSTIIAPKLEDRQRTLTRYLATKRFEIASAEAILPSTPLQEAMLAEMQTSDYAHYYNHDVLELQPDIDVEKLKAAWEMVFTHSAPILRTVYFHIDDTDISGGFAQVVLKGAELPWHERAIQGTDEIPTLLESLREEARKAPPETVQLRLTSVRMPASRLLIVSLPHAMYDGWSISLLHDAVRAAYYGTQISPLPLRDVIDQLWRRFSTDSEDFWQDYLSGARACNFSRRTLPQVPQVNSQERKASLRGEVLRAFCKRENVSLQAVGQACWALVLASHIQQLDVVYGVVLAGRETEELQQAIFPTMNTIAFRSILHGSRREFLRYVQDNLGAIRPHQYFPLRKVQALVPRKEARLFNSLFIHQVQPKIATSDSRPLYRSILSSSNLEYPVCVEMEVVGEDLVWRTSCHACVFDNEGAQAVLEDMDSILLGFVQEPNADTFYVQGTQVRISSLPGFELREPEQIATQSEATSANLKDVTPTATVIRSVLSAVSKIPEEDISGDSTIFHLGLDSISAIKVSSLLQKRGISLTVSNMIEATNIEVMAALADTTSVAIPSLDEDNSSVALYEKKVLQQLQFDPADIDFVSPATAGQIYALSMWQKSRGATFYARFEYFVEGVQGSSMIELAWEELVRNTPSLRTGFAVNDDSRFPVAQIVMKNVQYRVEQHNADHTMLSAPTGQPWVTLEAERTESQIWKLQLSIHHALYDAVSLSNLMKDFKTLLAADTDNMVRRSPVAFQRLSNLPVRTSYTSQARTFWAGYLGVNDLYLRLPQLQQPAGKRLEIFHPNLVDVRPIQTKLRNEGIGIQALFLAVVARLYSKLSGSTTVTQPETLQGFPDVVLGMYLANRSLPLAGVAEAVAPTFNVVPIRVRQPFKKSVLDSAKQVQEDLRAITKLENALVQLWHIDQWTGLKLDLCVNFLSLPDLQVDEEATATGSRIRQATDRSAYTRIVQIEERHGFEGLEGMERTGILPSYLPTVDVEAAVTYEGLDVGLFGPDESLNLQEGKAFLDGIRSGFVDFTS